MITVITFITLDVQIYIYLILILGLFRNITLYTIEVRILIRMRYLVIPAKYYINSPFFYSQPPQEYGIIVY